MNLIGVLTVITVIVAAVVAMLAIGFFAAFLIIAAGDPNE
jgi:hypothetical protein